MKDRHTASDYIRANFRPDDRLAVVLIQKSSGYVLQRLSTAEQIVDEKFQQWLHQMNGPVQRHEVYVSMNALQADAHGRTKSDIGEIRHVYLDFDVNGTEAVRSLVTRQDIPKPNHLIESSPGKWQSIWRVEGFDQQHAETLMRGMVRELGADPAATDSSRVLRLPGFQNHKYGKPHLVRVENVSEEVYRPERFPQFTENPPSREAIREHSVGHGHSTSPRIGITQSERDWAYAKRALSRGDDPLDVVRAIASHRPDKPNPEYYGEHTVERALDALNRAKPMRLEGENTAPDR